MYYFNKYADMAFRDKIILGDQKVRPANLDAGEQIVLGETYLAPKDQFRVLAPIGVGTIGGTALGAGLGSLAGYGISHAINPNASTATRLGLSALGAGAGGLLGAGTGALMGANKAMHMPNIHTTRNTLLGAGLGAGLGGAAGYYLGDGGVGSTILGGLAGGATGAFGGYMIPGDKPLVKETAYSYNPFIAYELQKQAAVEDVLRKYAEIDYINSVYAKYGV